MNDINAHPTYQEIHDACGELAEKIKRNRRHNLFDYIVPLARGGLVPATILSHQLNNIPVIPVVCSSVFGKWRNDNGGLVDINKELRSSTSHTPKPRILIVDDVCNFGNSFCNICRFYKNTGHETYSCALYFKKSPKSLFRPVYFWKEIPADAPYIHFPWEK